MEITLAEFQEVIRNAGYSNISIDMDRLCFSLKRMVEDGDGEVGESEVDSAYGFLRIAEILGTKHLRDLAEYVRKEPT